MRKTGSAFGTNATTTPPNLDGHVSPTTHSGKVVTCVIDGHGNYIPVTPNGSVSRAPIAHARGGRAMIHPAQGRPLGSNQQLTPRKGTPYGAMHAHGGSLGPRSDHHIGSPAFRANCGETQTPTREGRVFTSPSQLYPQKSLVEPMSPTAYRLLSKMGMQEFFDTPHNLREPKSMASLMPQQNGMQATPSKNTATFQGAVSSANFIPQSPQGPNPPVQGTPSHNQGHGLASPADRTSAFKTPSGCEIYPLPTDQASGPAAKTPVADPEKLRIEYLEALNHQAAMKAQLAHAKFEQAQREGATGSPKERVKRDAGVEED